MRLPAKDLPVPLPIIENGFRTVTTFSNIASGRPWSTCFDYKAREAPVSDAEDIAEAMETAWAGFFAAPYQTETMKLRIMPAVSLQNIVVYDLSSDSAAFETGPIPTIIGTESLTAALPPDVAICVSKRTATRGRRGRGRSYLGGWSSVVSTPTGAIIAPEAIAAAANNNFLTLVGIGAAEIADLVVISQAADPLGVTYPVTTLTVDANFDTQRRRGN